MNKNIGNIDRVIRFVFAAAIAVLFFTDVIGGIAGIVLLVLAAIVLLTVFVGTCPIYLLLRLNSKKAAK